MGKELDLHDNKYFAHAWLAASEDAVAGFDQHEKRV